MTSTDDRIPLQSLRDIRRLHRAFVAFPDAVLLRLVFPCVVCGSELKRGWCDGCLKCNRFRHAGCAGENIVYGLPCSILAPADRTSASLEELQMPGTSAASRAATISSCDGPGKTARMKAAVERAARTPLDQHGIYPIACGHDRCITAIEMDSPESIRGTVLLGMLLVFALGGIFVYNDIM